MEESVEKKLELFFPYYINQGRLLDIYAILNGGYSEFSELITTINSENQKGGKAELSVNGGFKLLNIGASVSGNVDTKDSQQYSSTEKKVQTITSILSIVKNTLSEKGYLFDIKEAKPGQFVCIPVNLSINSVKSLFEEMVELIKMSNNLQPLNSSVKKPDKDLKNYENLLKNSQSLFAGEEILYDTKEFAIIGNIVNSNLYQSTRNDLIGTSLNCLAQVKRVHPKGTELLKNTMFSKLKDEKVKEDLIEAMGAIANAKIYRFEAIAIPSIYGKPVFELEIIALYQ